MKKYRFVSLCLVLSMLSLLLVSCFRRTDVIDDVIENDIRNNQTADQPINKTTPPQTFDGSDKPGEDETEPQPTEEVTSAEDPEQEEEPEEQLLEGEDENEENVETIEDTPDPSTATEREEPDDSEIHSSAPRIELPFIPLD